MPPEETPSTFYFVEVTWTNGLPTRLLVDKSQLDGLDFATWRNNLVIRANARPQWVSLGTLAFHTQGVRSIELIETIEQEG